MSIEKLPSGKYRAVVRQAGSKRATEAVATQAEAKMLEAKLTLLMGAAPSVRGKHTVAEVVAGYIADGAVRLSPGSIDFYRKAASAFMPLGRTALRIATGTLTDGVAVTACLVSGNSRRGC